jgi:hypothetical protein
MATVSMRIGCSWEKGMLNGNGSNSVPSVQSQIQNYPHDSLKYILFHGIGQVFPGNLCKAKDQKCNDG